MAAGARDGGAPPDYLDLENPADLAKLDDTVGYLRSRSDRLVILDEVHRAPGLFGVLRGVIDERVLAGESAGPFLLLGSASIDLLKQASESLTGRIAMLELAPLDVLEIPPERESDLWIRGGFPRSLLANSDEASAAWRAGFIATYLERDIPQLGPRVPAETLRRFCISLRPCREGFTTRSRISNRIAPSSRTPAPIATRRATESRWWVFASWRRNSPAFAENGSPT